MPIKNTGDNGSVNEKVQNKNLFDINNETFIKRLNDTIVNVSNNSLVIKKVTSSMQERVTVYKQLKPNTTYALSTGNTPQTGGFFGGYLAAVDSISSSAYPNSSEGLSATATTNSSGILAIIFYMNTAFTGILTITNIQIEQGSTATSYVPHEEQTLSFPLAQGQKLMEGDYLADDGVHHVMGEVVFDGSDDEDWHSNGSGTDKDGISFSQFYIVIQTKKIGYFNVKANYFINASPTLANKIAGNNSNNRIYINIASSIVKNLSELKTWLSTHNLIVQYELAQEQIDPYTPEQQTAWEQIKALRTYKPVTHISSEDETPANVEIEYVRDLETVINNLSN